MKWGIKGQSIARMSLMLLCTVACLSTALIWLNYRDSMRTMRDTAVVYANAIGRSAEPGVLLNDPEALKHVAAAALEDESVYAARIIDSKGAILASVQRLDEFSPETPIDAQHPMNAGQPHGDARIDQSNSQLTVITPIWPANQEIELELLEDEPRPEASGGPIGYVVLVYTLDRIHSEFAGRVMSVIVMAGIAVAIGAGLTILGVRKMLGPLKNLVETTNAIAAGDRSKRSSEQAFAEFGKLARSFNFMADRLQESHESVEQEVHERTAELLLAKDAAEAASRAKSDFLANMSHEIRTPMTAILGFAENLLDPSLNDAERVNSIATVRRNGEHLLNIINDILDISKIEAGKLELEYLRCQVLTIIGEIESLMRARAENKGLRFSVELPDKLPETIETDPTRLRQILINLIGNAVKFTEEGGVKLSVSFVEADGENGGASPLMRFDVVDTGIGMTPEQIERAFKPFSQADETMTRRFGGTGLGLTISQHLATMLGGGVAAQSEPGKGTTLTVTVGTGPLDGVKLICPRDAKTERESERDAARPVAQVKLSCRVLLVEDGPDNQRLISFVLKKAGADVTLAENGQVAVDEVNAAIERDDPPFDVILMDMQMPILDGYAATSLLRRQGYRGPIVALTAHAMTTDRDRCLAAGCDDYVTKPIDRKKLLAIVDQYARGGVEAPKSA